MDPCYELSLFTIYLICITHLFQFSIFENHKFCSFTIYFIMRYQSALCKLYKLLNLGLFTDSTYCSTWELFNFGTFHLGLFTDSKYSHLALAFIQRMWTHFLYLSILTLVSTLFLQSNVDISVHLTTSIGTDLALLTL